MRVVAIRSELSLGSLFLHLKVNVGEQASQNHSSFSKKFSCLVAK